MDDNHNNKAMVVEEQHCGVSMSEGDVSLVPADSSEYIGEEATSKSTEGSGSLSPTSIKNNYTDALQRIVQQSSRIVEVPLTYYSNALRDAPLCTKAITSCIVAILGELIGATLRSKRRGDQKGLLAL